MSYVAPAATAVNFHLQTHPYVAPVGTGTNFNFGAGGSSDGILAQGQNAVTVVVT